MALAVRGFVSSRRSERAAESDPMYQETMLLETVRNIVQE